MDITNQDRKKHHSDKDCHSDEDSYSYDDSHDKKKKMYCPCMMCPCMQGMNMSPQQLEQPMGCGEKMSREYDEYDEYDEQEDLEADNEEMSRYRPRRPYYHNYFGGFPYLGFYPPYGYKHRPRPWNY